MPTEEWCVDKGFVCLKNNAGPNMNQTDNPLGLSEFVGFA